MPSPPMMTYAVVTVMNWRDINMQVVLTYQCFLSLSLIDRLLTSTEDVAILVCDHLSRRLTMLEQGKGKGRIYGFSSSYCCYTHNSDQRNNPFSVLRDLLANNI